MVEKAITHNLNMMVFTVTGRKHRVKFGGKTKICTLREDQKKFMFYIKAYFNVATIASRRDCRGQSTEALQPWVSLLSHEEYQSW